MRSESSPIVRDPRTRFPSIRKVGVPRMSSSLGEVTSFIVELLPTSGVCQATVEARRAEPGSSDLLCQGCVDIRRFRPLRSRPEETVEHPVVPACRDAARCNGAARCLLAGREVSEYESYSAGVDAVSLQFRQNLAVEFEAMTAGKRAVFNQRDGRLDSPAVRVSRPPWSYFTRTA